MTDPKLAQLGDEVRARRISRDMTMIELAGEAGIGRSTLHRLENAEGTRLQPIHMASVLHALAFTEDEARAILPDDDSRWLESTLRRLRMAPLVPLAQYARANGRQGSNPDLVAHRGETTLLVEVKGKDGDEDELVNLLKHAGFTVSRPV